MKPLRSGRPSLTGFQPAVCPLPPSLACVWFCLFLSRKSSFGQYRLGCSFLLLPAQLPLIIFSLVRPDVIGMVNFKGKEKSSQPDSKAPEFWNFPSSRRSLVLGQGLRLLPLTFGHCLSNHAFFLIDSKLSLFNFH